MEDELAAAQARIEELKEALTVANGEIADLAKRNDEPQEALNNALDALGDIERMAYWAQR